MSLISASTCAEGRGGERELKARGVHGQGKGGRKERKGRAERCALSAGVFFSFLVRFFRLALRCAILALFCAFLAGVRGACVVERLALALAAVEVPFELDAVHPLWRALLLRQVVRVVVVNCATTHKISFKPVGAETTALSRKTAA
eukprot:1461733-Rhodomonas_salina.2